VRRLLVVEDSAAERLSIEQLIAHDDVEITAVGSGAEALAQLRERHWDCVVLDLRLPDMSGFDLLAQVQQDAELRDVPIVVFTGRELAADEEEQLRRMAKSIVLKGVQSPERLLDETALFLHRVVAELPEPKRRMLEQLHQTSEALAGRKVLVVDDDVRNIFALSSVLERHGMHVVIATNGQEAIKALEQTPDISLALLDIMMPGMDGYETMRRIRQMSSFRRLPIVALTAKAMQGDREKCLEAGASDYIAKPVDTTQLLSLLRTWLHR
jgi:CheY-like chemotaxis protein